jgi:hypothetical protein
LDSGEGDDVKDAVEGDGGEVAEAAPKVDRGWLGDVGSPPNKEVIWMVI